MNVGRDEHRLLAIWPAIMRNLGWNFAQQFILVDIQIWSRVRGCCLARQNSRTKTKKLLGMCVPFMGCSLQCYAWLYTLFGPSMCSSPRYIQFSSGRYVPSMCIFFCMQLFSICLYVSPFYVYIFSVCNSSPCVALFSVYLSLFVIGTSLRNTPC